jgi:hypothetical protein
MYHIRYLQPKVSKDDPNCVVFGQAETHLATESDAVAIKRLSSFLEEKSVSCDTKIYLRKLVSFCLFLPLPSTSQPIPEHLSLEESPD